MVAHDVGVHVSKERLGGITQTHFIPHSHIHDIIIHEAITMVTMNNYEQIHYYGPL